jgi:DNA mismatch repair protein MutH
MVAYRDLGQPERARAMAREYLRLQPKGAYAKVAHEIVE